MISEKWFEMAKGVKDGVFCRFFYLWCAFNALYNLVGKYSDIDIVRIHRLINRLSEGDKKFILEKCKENCDYFMLERPPIKDMQRQLYGESQPDDVQNFPNIQSRYNNPDVSPQKKLGYIVDILYRIRNNLTHGSKETNGMDKIVITKANPILEILVCIILKKCS